MRIAIDVSPLQSGHKVRGVGFYLTHLKHALETHFKNHEYLFFTGEAPGNVEIIHYPYFDPFIRTLPFKKSIPTVVTVHDLTPIVFPDHFPAGIKGNIIWQLNRYILGKIDGIITDSDSSTKDVLRLIPINQKKVRTIYLAAGDEFTHKKLSAERQKELIEKYHLPKNFALYVGDVTWNKNLPRLLTSAVKAEVPIVLVGKALTEKQFDHTNPWNRDRFIVQELLAKYHQYFYPLGFISSEDLVSLYNLATVFIMPSLYEGFGLPVIEAMSAGCPVITSREGSLPEVGGKAVYYIDAYSETSISHGLKEVFNDKKLQLSLSSNGLDQAARFSWKKNAQETLEMYEKVITNK